MTKNCSGAKDNARVLGSATRDQVKEALEKATNESGGHFAVLLINSIGEAERYASKAFEPMLDSWFDDRVTSEAIELASNRPDVSDAAVDRTQDNVAVPAPASTVSYSSPSFRLPNGFPAEACQYMSAAGISDHFYTTLFQRLQGAASRTIAKCWIKIIEPKKQSKFPYQRGDGGRPPWWPSNVRHKEPDHLRAIERNALLLGIVRSGAIPMSELEAKTFETIREVHRDKLIVLQEMFIVAKEDERIRSTLHRENAAAPSLQDPPPLSIEIPSTSSRNRSTNSPGTPPKSAGQFVDSNNSPVAVLKRRPSSSHSVQQASGLSRTFSPAGRGPEDPLSKATPSRSTRYHPYPLPDPSYAHAQHCFPAEPAWTPPAALPFPLPRIGYHNPFSPHQPLSPLHHMVESPINQLHSLGGYELYSTSPTRQRGRPPEDSYFSPVKSTELRSASTSPCKGSFYSPVSMDHSPLQHRSPSKSGIERLTELTSSTPFKLVNNSPFPSWDTPASSSMSGTPPSTTFAGTALSFETVVQPSVGQHSISATSSWHSVTTNSSHSTVAELDGSLPFLLQPAAEVHSTPPWCATELKSSSL